MTFASRCRVDHYRVDHYRVVFFGDPSQHPTVTDGSKFAEICLGPSNVPGSTYRILLGLRINAKLNTLEENPLRSATDSVRRFTSPACLRWR